jgi:hypothetical protein
MSEIEALGYASTSRWNYIGISQPDKKIAGGGFVADYSTPFSLQPDLAETFLKTQFTKGHREEYENWKIKVGVAVGVGVPILLVAFWALGYKQGLGRTRPLKSHDQLDN